MTTNQEAFDKKVSQVIAKCWADEGFKRTLMANPAATLAGEGVELPAGQSVKVLENDATVFHLVIPAKPSELSDEDLTAVTGGTSDTHALNAGVDTVTTSSVRPLIGSPTKSA